MSDSRRSIIERNGQRYYEYRIKFENPICKERYVDEIKFIQANPHTNIAAPTSVKEFEADGPFSGYAIVEVPCPMVTLYELLGRGTIQNSQIHSILKDIADAVCFLHQRGEQAVRDAANDEIFPWHGFLSPNHIEITEGRAIINDYGYYLSRCYHHPLSSHCAPEIINLSHPPDRSADCYAFGILMIELYSDKPAFEGWPKPDLNNLRIGWLVAKGIHPPIPDTMPPDPSELCRKCLSLKREDRPSMADIAKFFH